MVSTTAALGSSGEVHRQHHVPAPVWRARQIRHASVKKKKKDGKTVIKMTTTKHER